MSKRFVLFCLILLSLSGCASIEIPYLHTDNQKFGQAGVIILHTSSGLDSGEFDYARLLKSHGFAVAVVDYHVKGGTDNIGKAYDQLVKDSRVDPNKIGLVGFSRGAHVAISTSDLSNRFKERKYKAIVSFYIGPYVNSNSEFIPPILFLHGDQDVYVKKDRIETFCDVQKRIYKTTCDYIIFDNTRHSFDRSRSKYQGYDHLVTLESYKKSIEFLKSNLK